MNLAITVFHWNQYRFGRINEEKKTHIFFHKSWITHYTVILLIQLLTTDTDTTYTNLEQDRECNTLLWQCPDCGLAAEQESEGTTWCPLLKSTVENELEMTADCLP